jgi:NAD dependent epimerase/dehydratase family enzyme
MGGYLGSGRQWMSWVTLHDPIRAIEFAMETERLSGPLNVAAPNPLTNAQFTRTLGTKLHRPTPLRVPTLLLRIGFGEMMMATILESRRVMPARLRRAGFRFEQPVLAQALPALVYGP